MKNQNEIVQTLANLPTWGKNHREAIAVELKTELARISAAVGIQELIALATELPAWWQSADESTMDRPPMPENLFAITRSVTELNLRPSEILALQLLIADHRDKKFIATRIMNGNFRSNLVEKSNLN